MKTSGGGGEEREREWMFLRWIRNKKVTSSIRILFFVLYARAPSLLLLCSFRRRYKGRTTSDYISNVVIKCVNGSKPKNKLPHSFISFISFRVGAKEEWEQASGASKGSKQGARFHKYVL